MSTCEYCNLTIAQSHHAQYMVDKIKLLSAVNEAKAQVYELQQLNKKLVEILSSLTKENRGPNEQV